MKIIKTIIWVVLVVTGLLIPSELLAVDYNSNTVDGAWNNSASWLPVGVPGSADNVTILSGDKITISTGNNSVTDLTIESGGTLYQDNKKLTVNGDYINNGTHLASQEITLNGTGTKFEGTGRIKVIASGGGANMKIENARTISASSDLVIDILAGSGNFQINGPITNNGKVNLSANVTGTSTWTNEIDSEIEIGPENFGATINASAAGNTVSYFSGANQNIRTPVSNTYYNLHLEGANTKFLTGNLIVNGDFLNIAEMDVTTSNYSLTLKGDFENTGTFNARQGNITLDGTTDQTITNSGASIFYNLTIDNTTGTIILVDDITIENTFDLTDGTINCGVNTVTLGLNTTTIGTFSYTSGKIIGSFERWINDASGGINFPVGTSSGLLSVLFTSSSITAGSLKISFSENSPGNSGSTWTESSITFYNTFGDGYWIAEALNSFASTNYTLQLRIADLQGFPIDNNERIVYRSNSSNPWILSGTHGSNDGTNVTRAGLSSFGEFAIIDNLNCTPPSSPAISGAITACTGDTDTYSVIDNPPYTYDWGVIGGTISSGQGTNSVNIDWSLTGGNRTVTVRANDPACTFSDLSTYSVTVEPFPTSDIAGRSILASGTLGEIYSVTDQGYTYTWSKSGAGSGTDIIQSGQGTDSITMDWGDPGVTQLEVVASKAGCPVYAAPVVTKQITKFFVYTSAQTGNFNVGSTWVGGAAPTDGDNIRISANHTVSLTSDVTLDNVIIESNGVLSNNNRNITITGIYEVNGEHRNTSNKDVTLNSTGLSDIYGDNGLINSQNFTITGGGRTINSNSTITVTASNSFDIDNTSLTNDGYLVINTDNNDFTLTGSGSLDASTIGNTIEYAGTSPTIRNPLASTFQNLVISGTDAALQNATIISGDLTVTGTININGQSVTLAGTTQQNITGNIAFVNLTVNNSATGDAIVINDLITISTNLTFSDGIINTSSGIVEVLNAATLTGYSNSSFINGPMKYSGVTNATKVFPVGKSTEMHQVDLTVNGTLADYTIEYILSSAQSLGYALPGTLDRVSDIGYWTISRSPGTPVTSASVKLYYDTSDVVSDPPNLRVAKDNGAAAWLDQGGTGTGAPSGSITSTTNFTSFGFFSLANSVGGNNPLPVTLYSFKGIQENQQVLLSWKTATEINNDIFTIERSANGYDFKKIGTKRGSGNTSSIVSYKFYDERPISGMLYYRIKQTDFNGKYQYSKIIAVKFDPFKNLEYDVPQIMIYPNPVKGDIIYVNVNALTQNNAVEVSIIDRTGKIYYLDKKELTYNQFDIPIERNLLKRGLYFLRISNLSKVLTTRFIIN